MKRLHTATTAFAASTILRSAYLGLALLLSTILLGSPPAGALPPASGSKCNSNWVNNPGAMACFIQGEEDLRNGVARPHYVACTAAGDVFCCVDKAGGQDCESVRIVGGGGGGRQAIENAKVRAMLESQQTIATVLSGVSIKLDNLASRMPDPSVGGGNRMQPNDTRATDEAAVRAASAEWARVASAKDLEKTLSYYAEDAAMFPPNMAVATGSEARRKVWTQLFAAPDLVFSNAATKVEAARSGDLAYETGTFEESFKDGSGKTVRAVGKYVVVWKKQASGQWKAILDVFNTDRVRDD